MCNLAYLSLGSNINPEENLPAAVVMLAQLTRLVAVSSVWETEALGDKPQPPYLNAAVIIETDLTPTQLKGEVLTVIEDKLGRVRQANKFAPRPIDLDIMLFNREIIQLGHRHIPDPEIIERPFVTIPLAEVAPDYQHPELEQTLAEIARGLIIKEGEMRLHPQISQALALIESQFATSKH
jgi:2-amino-4-hydroxy-6-hydroxymethyldihydropteridine diphosphokinase